MKRRALLPTCMWLAAALTLTGCDTRGSYDPLPTQPPLGATLKQLQATSPKPVRAAKGALICSMEPTAGKDWDVALPFTGGALPDLEARLQLGDERWRTTQEHDDLRAVQLSDVTITPGETLRLGLYDIDSYVHDELGSFEIILSGEWPLAYGNANISGACYLRTAAEASAGLKAQEEALRRDLKKAEATFSPDLTTDYFDYQRAKLHELQPRALELAAHMKGAEAKRVGSLVTDAEARWAKRAQDAIAAAVQALPPLGAPTRLGPLEITAQAARCGAEAHGAAQEFTVTAEAWATLEHTCAVVLTGRNATDAPIALQAALAESTATLQLDGAAHPLLARATSGLPAATSLAAVQDDAGAHPATIHAPETWASGQYTGTLAPGQTLKLLITARNLPRGEPQRQDGPTVLMMSGDVRWRTR